MFINAGSSGERGRADIRKIVLLSVATLLAVGAGSARAATDESKCLAGRAEAWGTYEACVQKLFAVSAGLSNLDDGGAYNDFLEDLNAGTGFSDANSWRLPTLAELLTIRGVPEIGAYNPGKYWTRSLDQTNSGQAWRVHFGAPSIETAPKWSVNFTRAVRGGLCAALNRLESVDARRSPPDATWMPLRM